LPKAIQPTGREKKQKEEGPVKGEELSKGGWFARTSEEELRYKKGKLI